MKKFSVFLVSILLFAFASFAGAVNLQVADNPNRPETSGPCMLIDGNGVAVSSSNVLTVSTPAENDNAMLKCKGKVTPPPNKMAMFYSPATPGFEEIPCVISQDGLPIGATSDWQQTLSASGMATLTCHYKTTP
jgi:hypothetical protein